MTHTRIELVPGVYGPDHVLVWQSGRRVDHVQVPACTYVHEVRPLLEARGWRFGDWLPIDASCVLAAGVREEVA